MQSAIERSAQPLHGTAEDYAALLARIGAARFVLLGEATHGTHEFYEARARITQALIERLGFDAVAAEADWPDAYRINRYVRGASSDASARQSLQDFQRFPAWMWRNTDMLAFIDWLRAHNDAIGGSARKVGFYGLDLYSLYASIDAVLRYFERVDPAAARRARDRYACFDHFDRSSDRYAYATAFGASASCEDEVIAQLAEMQRGGASAFGTGAEPDEHFYAVQNARLVRNAEQYYRTMFRGRVSSWNLRDRHMAETLAALDAHLSRDAPARIVVWAHNSHVGDARATHMGKMGEWTIGQLVRERYGADAFLVGFTTSRGTVIAASDWGGPARRRRVKPALSDSYEDFFHQSGVARFMLELRAEDAKTWLRSPRLERAIGVVYLPDTERLSHYFDATLERQFDAVVHFDETTALEPLDRSGESMSTEEEPETYPSGL